MHEFSAKINQLKKRAQSHLEAGAVTGNYEVDRETLLKVLNEALATEIVCVLRYWQHYHNATGIHAKTVKEEFLEHAKSEQEHVDMIAKRIRELNGDPDFSPAYLVSRAHTDFGEATNLIEMIKDDLIAERIVIEIYLEMIRFVNTGDPTTRRMFEDILADEEAHADELKDLLANILENNSAIQSKQMEGIESAEKTIN